MARKRSDIVLSMTLAETFLILLFLVWLGDVVGKSGAEPPTDPTLLKAENDRLTKDNERLSAQLKQAESEVRRLTLIVDAFRKSLGINAPIDSAEQVPNAVEAAREAARRGAPKCEETDNLFARVSIHNGVTTLTVTASPTVATAVSSKTGVSIPVGIALTDNDEIETVLRGVSDYSGANACRFDYTLTHQTKADYYDGRERFEKGRLFYAARIIPAPNAPR